MSGPNSNILLNPIPELTAALRTNAWGIDPSSEILIADCFPITPEDVEAVRAEVEQRGSSARVVGKARVVNLEGVIMVVQLDQRGFTIESASDTTGKVYPKNTYETLEALLIATSPLYVEAMTREVSRRFEGFSQTNEDEAANSTAEEERVAEDGARPWR